MTVEEEIIDLSELQKNVTLLFCSSNLSPLQLHFEVNSSSKVYKTFSYFNRKEAQERAGIEIAEKVIQALKS